MSIAVNAVHAASVKRDIDLPEDIQWLCEQIGGEKAWKYVKDISLKTPIDRVFR